MLLPRVNESFPANGRHLTHRAVIVEVDLHGVPAWDVPTPNDPVPTVRVRCSCGAEWDEQLPEAIAV